MIAGTFVAQEGCLFPPLDAEEHPLLGAEPARAPNETDSAEDRALLTTVRGPHLREGLVAFERTSTVWGCPQLLSKNRLTVNSVFT